MSRCPGRHAKTTLRYEGRHIKPGAPSPAAAVIGTAAKAVPVSLVAGAAGSALVLTGTASAATTSPNSPLHGATDLATAKTATATWMTQGRHAAARTVYTVHSGDTLSAISGRFCGTAADYPSLAAARSVALRSGLVGPAVAAEAVPVSTSAEPAAPATSETGTALAAVPITAAAGLGAPGLMWRPS